MIKIRLIKLMEDSKKYIYKQVGLQILSLFAQIIFIFSLASIFENELNNAYLYVVIIIVCILIRYICDKYIVKYAYKAGVDVKYTLRSNIYKKILKLKASYKEKISTAEIVQLSTEGVEQLEIYFSKYLAQFFYSMIAPIILFIVLSFISIKASIILFVIVPLIPLSIVVIQKLAKRLLNKYWKIYAGLGDSFLENLQGLTTLKIYQADEYKSKEMDKEANKFRRITMKVLTMQLNSTSVMDIFAYGGAAIGMIVAINEKNNGAIDFAGAFMIILLAAEFFLPLRLLGSYFHIAMNGMAASDKIFALLDLEEPDVKKGIINSNDLFIEIRDLNYSYNSDRQVLTNVNMNIMNKSLTAIVGESGCGKSTIAKLLMGKNINYEGSIKINGLELSEINQENLINNVTMIGHNSYLFKGTIRENVLMGKRNASDKEIIDVLRLADIYDYLITQDGLDTLVLEKGSNFSTGQIQRIALARALLHDTPIYIFDEATSNIDVESEKVIMNVIRELAKKKTVIVISHRLMNIINANEIYVIDQGLVVESGKHQELINNKSTYQKMFNLQKDLEKYTDGGLTNE